ncbi:MAG: TRAP transporter substrate-binding protein DctP [Nitratireductor sp.]
MTPNAFHGARFLLAALGAGLAAPALAQETTLRVADSFPSGHYVYTAATQPFMDRVSELSGGRLGFEYYPAQQLGKAKEMLELINGQVADVAYVAPSYISDKLPLAAVGELPLGYSDPCVGTRAFWAVSRPGAALHDAELKQLGIRILFATMLPPNQLVTADPIEGLDDIAGTKIRTSGGTKDQFVNELGAAPIHTTATELYEAFSRGTIDGLLIPLTSLPPYDLHTIAKSATYDQNLGGFTITYAMTEARWQDLSAQERGWLEQAGSEITEQACATIAANTAGVIAELEQAGVSQLALSQDDRARIDAISDRIARDWAQQQDGRGLAGSKVLEAFKDAMQ